MTQVCEELLDRLEKAGEAYATLTVLYATAPLRNASDVAATHGLLRQGECDFSMAVAEFFQPVHQALIANDYGAMQPVFHDNVAQRASGMPRYFAGNGSTYCVDVKAFKAKPGFYGAPLRGHIMPRERSIDIDTIDDFHLAEFYAKKAGV